MAETQKDPTGPAGEPVMPSDVLAQVLAGLEFPQAEHSVGYDAALMQQLKDMFGGNICDPDDVIAQLRAKGINVTSFDQSNYPPLPKDILQILNQPCPHTEDNNGSVLVGHTHVLSYLPYNIEEDGVPKVLTLKWLAEKFGDVLWSGNNYGNQQIKQNRPDSLPKGVWSLIPLIPVKGTRKTTESQSRNVLANNFKDTYEEVEALEVATALLFRALLTGERKPDRLWGRTATRVGPALCVYVGDFDSHGLGVYGGHDDCTDSLRGRFAHRILSDN